MPNYQKYDSPIVLREYGRNVQRLVEKIKSEPDYERRSQKAREIVRIMTTVAPATTENPEWRRLVWQQLYRIAGYELDVDSPVELVKPTTTDSRPVHPGYGGPTANRYKQYGRNVAAFLTKAADTQDPVLRRRKILAGVELMRQFAAAQGLMIPNDESLCAQVEQMTEGKIRITPEFLAPTAEDRRFERHEGKMRADKRTDLLRVEPQDEKRNKRRGIKEDKNLRRRRR
ncbi:MAG: DUF4290 domain-containing protein [Bacteroidia bacterium]|nr:DUF4290 domain-containing protein [Bacteroidia bacterium]